MSFLSSILEESDLSVNSARSDSNRALSAIKRWGELSGLRVDTRKNRALFTVSFYDKSDFLVLSVTGWHGSGSGDRYYGNTFALLSITGGDRNPSFRKEFLDTTRDVDLGDAGREFFFRDSTTKKKYVAALDRVSRIFVRKTPDRLSESELGVSYSNLFKKELAELGKRDKSMAQRVAKKVDEFLRAKTSDPIKRFGTNDRPMKGPLSGYSHFHVSRNPAYVVVYKISGGVIHLLSVVDHEHVLKSQLIQKLAANLKNI